jgi:hypothetical protein
MRSALIPRLIALIGLAGMLVVVGLQLAALNVESGDRVLTLSYVNIGIGVVTTIAASLWIAWSPRKAAAIVVLVVSVLFNPIWLLLLIRAFG